MEEEEKGAGRRSDKVIFKGNSNNGRLLTNHLAKDFYFLILLTLQVNRGEHSLIHRSQIALTNFHVGPR